jgi:hypothetical protein
MYIVGAVEIFMLYIVPEAKIFEDTFHCFRLLGTIWLFLLGLLVLAGVRVVSKFSLPTVFLVVACIFLVIIGSFVRFNGSDSLKFCAVGDRLPNLMKWRDMNRDRGLLPCSVAGLSEIFCTNHTLLPRDPNSPSPSRATTPSGS